MVDAETKFDGFISIEVAYAKPEQQIIVEVAVPQGTTVQEAINRSGLLERFPEMSATELKVGIFGSLCKLDQSLKQGDRVEIYRPLICDPKEARRKRANKL